MYAYLRWSVDGKTHERYVGEVAEQTRSANLAMAWRLAHKRSLTLVVAADEAPTSGVRQPASWASSPAVRSVMRGNKGRDTKPELALRSAIHRLGLRYRVGVRPLPKIRRTADVVFPRAKVAVFLDGCFWHGCPDHHRPAKVNSDFWTEKLAGNKARDVQTDSLLAAERWMVIRVWEHEEPFEAAQRVAEAVRARIARQGQGEIIRRKIARAEGDSH
ncbi:very short patch repair endonuclease [Micromonospora zingiberis]|uniref:very short patch repair endonuclease n=1 Tax=Micromonospora zingiberis TaxID=2053011 RepID=UPI001F0D3E23|nr:very short patch repair endonuclease [Micromonospora zingiberis]